MKTTEEFDFDKRLIDRLIRMNPSHKTKIKEYIEKLKDTSDNVETISIKELFPKKKQKGTQS
ncbi:MAG: hypothetical protein N2746_05785 [Deltaproteobacteria bacterium]|nr:hypothetical protein [Deltaproteobacteria bacterium]